MLYFAENSLRKCHYDLEWGGGGQNSLDSPKTGDNSDFESDKINADLSDDNQDEKSTWDTPTYKTYSDYFTDFNITKETITSEDYIGTGTANNPFIVRSTRGFLYLTNYFTFTGVSFDNKYVELDCDIVLNEEIFDENGIPSGGDGVVYEWSSRNNSLKEINGKNHTIYGLWQSVGEGESGGVGFVREYQTIYSMRDINFENVFVENKSTKTYQYVITYYAEKMDNCNLLSGTFRTAGAHSSAFCVILKSEIKNCDNRLNVISTAQSCSGMVNELKGTMKNCNNYGNISVVVTESNGRAAGLATVPFASSKVINCNNYGNIYTNGQQAGGIVMWLDGGCLLSGCNNYGTIETEVRAGGGIAAIANSITKDATIFNCHNFGLIKRTQDPTHYGELLGSIQLGIASVLIKDCSGNSSSCCPLVGFIDRGNIFIDNCKTNTVFDDFSSNYFSLLIGQLYQARAELKNIEVNIECKNLTTAHLFTTVPGYDYANVYLQNVIINLACESLEYQSIGMSYFQNINIHSLVTNYKIGNEYVRNYYGSDFSGFYCEWKTGEIGLKALSGKGFYQTTLSEEILQNKGYVKKA